MECIIMAGGSGRRSNSFKKPIPKVLLKDRYGISLIENILTQIKRNIPIAKVSVMLGYQHEEVKEVIDQYIKENLEQKVRTIYNPQYRKGIVNSLYLGVRDVDDSVVIMNGDTYYAEETFRTLARLSRSSLMVLPKSQDYSDSINVLAKGLKIMNVGKNLSEFNYISVGCLFLSKNHLKYLKPIIKEMTEKGDLEKVIWHNLINIIINSGQKVFINEISDYDYYEIDTAEDYRQFILKTKSK